MKRKWILLCVMTISLSFVSGCWSKKELTELAIMSATGIDKNEEGKYVKTFQIINPGNVSGGLQGGGGGQGPAVTVYQAEGDSIFEVFINASAKISRRLYHAHANLIVISEELAKEEGVGILLDAFERNAEARASSRLVIAHDMKAEDLVKSLTAIDKIPAEKINKTVEITEKISGGNMVVTLQDFIKASASPGIEPVISGFGMQGDAEEGTKQENIQQAELDATLEGRGLAIFKDDKLVDWYDGETARGAVWILDKVQQTNVELDWEGKKQAIAYNISRQKTNISADIQKGTPEITVHVRAEGRISEVTAPVDLRDPEVIWKIEEEAEKEIKKQLEKTIKRTQKNKSDILGFGQVVYRSDPRKWRKLEDDWNDNYFPKLNVHVKVEAFIRRTGLRTNSHLSDLK